MKPPTLRPTADAQMSERRHCDPPALWLAVILGSLVIHLCAFGILRLLLMQGFLSLQLGKEIIPIDVIAVAPNRTSPTRLTPTTGAKATKNPTVNTPRKTTSNQRQNRQTSPASNPSATRTTSPQANSSKLSPSPKPRKSPASNASQNQPSGGHKPSTNPTPPKGKPNQSGSGTSSPNPPNPTPSTGSSTGETSPNSQPGGGFGVSLGELSASANDDLPDPGKRCKRPNDYTKKFSGDSLKQLGVNLDQVLVLDVLVVIETTGKAELEPRFTKVRQGNISADQAEQLATEVIKSWQFERNCTLSGGKPVPYPYSVQLTIRPNQK